MDKQKCNYCYYISQGQVFYYYYLLKYLYLCFPHHNISLALADFLLFGVLRFCILMAALSDGLLTYPFSFLPSLPFGDQTDKTPLYPLWEKCS